MKIETQAQDNCTLTMTVEVEDERVQPALRSAARRLAKQYKFPGFRPGKAPYETVVRQVGEQTVYGEALEELGNKVYQEALEQENVEAFAPGELDDVQFKPMVLKFSVPLPPQVELGDYRNNLRVPFEAPQVTDEAVQKDMDTLREQQVVIEPAEQPAALGNMVTLDAKAFLNEGENPSDFLMGDEDVSLVLEDAADWPMPGFAAHIVGMSAGEQKKFDLPFSDDYPNESLRGQVAHFEVTLKEVKLRTLPEWSDELARELGEFESLDDLRAKTRAGLEAQAEQGARREYADKVIAQLVERAEVKYPPVLLEQEIDRYMEDLDQRLRAQKITLEDYLKMQAQTREEFRDDLKPQAQERLKRSLVLGEVVNRERLDVDPEHLAMHIQEMAAMYGERADAMREMLLSERAQRMVALDLLTDAAVDRLIAIARGEEVPALDSPPADLAFEIVRAEDESAAEGEAGEQPEASAEGDAAAESDAAAEGSTDEETAPAGASS